MRPDYARYQRLQALYCVQARYLHRTIAPDEFREAAGALTPAERTIARLVGPAAGALLRHTPAAVRRWLGAAYDRLVRQFPSPDARAQREVGRYQDMLEVFESASDRLLAAHR